LIFRMLADFVVIVHLGFVLFVVLGGLLVLRWPRAAWAHLPAAAWGALIEFGGWICPLTPLENLLRTRAGEVAYSGGFVEQYILPALYPLGLTRTTQAMIGLFVLLVNGVVYTVAIRRKRERQKTILSQ